MVSNQFGLTSATKLLIIYVTIRRKVIVIAQAASLPVMYYHGTCWTKDLLTKVYVITVIL